VSSIILSCPVRKRRIAQIAHWTGLTAIAGAVERRDSAFRVVNCHSVPERYASGFEGLIRRLSRSWAFAAPADLPGLLRRDPDRPTLLFCFDDGLANTVRVAAPILEAAGGRAVFAIPAAWPDVPARSREEWFRQRVYPAPTELHALKDDLIPASWAELRESISRGHEVWSHGTDHVRLTNALSAAVLEREIIDSRRILESRLGSPIRGYCPPIAHDVPPAALALIRSTYELAFGGRPAAVSSAVDTHRLPRSNIEASWPTPVVAMQLSPLGDAVTNLLSRARGLRE
jgi:peptidoglycan/xylan/chitin deacetylase (PgdA/CDA1 family)